MKFGGTSMGSAERMRVAADLISAHALQRPVAVVVSAMSKITDLLLETLHRAELGDRSVVDTNVDLLLQRHLKACSDLFSRPEIIPARESASELITSLIAEFRRITNGVL